MKILIVAHDCKWKTWNAKIEALKAWFSPAIDLQIELIHKDFTSIPWEKSTNSEGVKIDRIKLDWFKKNITSPNHDITIFTVNQSDWNGGFMDGYQNKGGIAIGCKENGKYNFQGKKYTGDKWFNIAIHELGHMINELRGIPDNVHKYWNEGNIEQILIDIKKTSMNSSNTPVKYKFFKNSEIIGLNPSLVELLDKARGIAGIPFKINSGKRSVKENKNAGGVEDSSHLTGYAVDLSCTTSDARWKIVNSLIQVGFKRIGIGETFVHADIDPSKVHSVIWTYY